MFLFVHSYLMFSIPIIEAQSSVCFLSLLDPKLLTGFARLYVGSPIVLYTRSSVNVHYF